MKAMRTLAAILVLCTLLLAAPVRAADKLLPIVFEDYPPYEYVEDYQVKGINIDIIREAFSRMGLAPVFEPRPWKRALYQLRQGEILALSSGFKTSEREEFIYYPSEPLAMETNVVAALAVSGAEVTSLEDLRPLRIGVVREYVYGGPFDTMYGLNKIEASSSHQLIDMLLEQRVDVAIGNRAVFRHIARKLGKLAHVKFIHEVAAEPLYLMFSRAHGAEAEDLARRFGETVRRMRKDGTFQAIRARY